MGIIRHASLFSIGGLSYIGLELLWRGRSHKSMFLAGGTAFLLLGALSRATKRPLLRTLGGAGVITAVELVAGLLFNRSYHIWDYRHIPYNYKGQICLLFSLLWIPVGQTGIWLYGKIQRLFPEKVKFSLDK